MLSILSALMVFGQSKFTIYIVSGGPADIYTRILEKACKETRLKQDKWTGEVRTFLEKQSVQEELAVAERMRQKWLDEMPEQSTSHSEV
jgi:hypothetical protein